MIAFKCRVTTDLHICWSHVISNKVLCIVLVLALDTLLEATSSNKLSIVFHTTDDFARKYNLLEDYWLVLRCILPVCCHIVV